MFVFENPYIQVHWLDEESRTILVTWKKETENFDDESFKNNFLAYLDKVLLKLKPVKIIHDLADFLYFMPLELHDWVAVEVNQVAVENGTLAVAMIVLPDKITQIAIEMIMNESDAPLHIKYFSDFETAKKWIERL
ncbi:MAG: hypothetical protein MUE85_22655 [Microscillaceae bacterium]|jgi:hypothetical protein|nr:hypothetical protein [Microscillaceae bacterium]